jgi:hypothetical protein
METEGGMSAQPRNIPSTDVSNAPALELVATQRSVGLRANPALHDIAQSARLEFSPQSFQPAPLRITALPARQ